MSAIWKVTVRRSVRSCSAVCPVTDADGRSSGGVRGNPCPSVRSLMRRSVASAVRSARGDILGEYSPFSPSILVGDILRGDILRGDIPCGDIPRGDSLGDVFAIFSVAIVSVAYLPFSANFVATLGETTTILSRLEARGTLGGFNRGKVSGFLQVLNY